MIVEPRSAFATPVPKRVAVTVTATCAGCGQVLAASGVGVAQAKRHLRAQLDVHRYGCAGPPPQDEVI